MSSPAASHIFNDFCWGQQVVNGINYKIRTGISWRNLPQPYGPWQTVSPTWLRPVRADHLRRRCQPDLRGDRAARHRSAGT
ncbi:hypothetical protein DKG34_21885 [Streptomyces sp. NWU49]|uniref:transposase n=1 Tax=Streptomyces sp. NWU49 TaxID=2201153 RepID=UPI000D6722F6|nr:hypothetical protein DKG34_21885 [Streptomyces sp. NWU49]